MDCNDLNLYIYHRLTLHKKIIQGFLSRIKLNTFWYALFSHLKMGHFYILLLHRMNIDFMLDRYSYRIGNKTLLIGLLV